MKFKYLQIKKRETVYHAVCDKTEQRYIAEVFELLKEECDRWGLEFSREMESMFCFTFIK